MEMPSCTVLDVAPQAITMHTCSCAGGLSVDLPATSLDGVAWFVQISDLHLSRYDHLPERQKLYGDKAGDLRCPSLPLCMGMAEDLRDHETCTFDDTIWSGAACPDKSSWSRRMSLQYWPAHLRDSWHLQDVC